MSYVQVEVGWTTKSGDISEMEVVQILKLGGAIGAN